MKYLRRKNPLFRVKSPAFVSSPRYVRKQNPRSAPSPSGGGLGWGNVAKKSLSTEAKHPPLPTSPRWGEALSR